MSVWFAIALAVTGSACMNLGLVLQKKGIDPPAARSGDTSTFRHSRHAPIWFLGIAMMIGGYALYAAAVSARVAPISLLQPLSASGLLVVAFLAVIYLNERFDSAEWFGVGFLLTGVILLGLSARGLQLASNGVEPTRYLAFFAIVLTLATAVAFAVPSLPRRAELLLGVLSGLLFGTGYLNTKALALAVQDRSLGLTLISTVLMTLGLLGGLVALQFGLRAGRALIVTAINLVTNQVLVVAGGLVCLGESLPRETLPFAARIAGLCGILAGIALLARVGAGGAFKVFPPTKLLGPPGQSLCRSESGATANGLNSLAHRAKIGSLGNLQASVSVSLAASGTKLVTYRSGASCKATFAPPTRILLRLALIGGDSVMKTLLTFAAILCFAALPVYSADGQVSDSSLTRLGLAGMKPISDVQGLEIRGLGVMQAMGMRMDEDFDDNKQFGHDNDKDNDHRKEHKHHEHKHHEHQHHQKHEHFKADFHMKPHFNFSSMCHVHMGKAG
jgi:uncharacterized membrane protein